MNVNQLVIGHMYRLQGLRTSVCMYVGTWNGNYVFSTMQDDDYPVSIWNREELEKEAIITAVEQ